MSNIDLKPRKHLNADAMLNVLRKRFEEIPDSRVDPTCSLPDTLMSGVALFALKDPSLLAFDQRRKVVKSNLQTVFKIEHVPSDSQMRDILDTVDPNSLRPGFTDLFRQVQRGKGMEDFVFLDGHYLMSFDGTEYFSSHKIHCPQCLVKEHRNGTVTYHHQMMTAVLIHPDHAEVLPLAPEPIQKQDGATKNDCELNAAKRFFPAFRADHPHLPVIATGDGLTSNAPLVKLLRDLKIVPLLVAKPGDHTFLFEQMEKAFAEGRTRVYTYIDLETNTIHHFRWLNQASLNEANQDVQMTLLEYWEIKDGKVLFRGSWVTDLEVREDNVAWIVCGARAHWKIENETFNTLKNQGYHFDHNFGHGVKYLSVVFAILMLLAFTLDQIQQICCPLFYAAWKAKSTKRQFWDEMRHLFHSFVFETMLEVYEALIRGIDKHRPVLLEDSS